MIGGCNCMGLKFHPGSDVDLTSRFCLSDGCISARDEFSKETRCLVLASGSLDMARRFTTIISECRLRFRFLRRCLSFGARDCPTGISRASRPLPCFKWLLVLRDLLEPLGSRDRRSLVTSCATCPDCDRGETSG